MLSVCKDLVDKELKLGLVLTGGGLGVLDELTKFGGASQFLVFSHTPYCKQSSYDYLGKKVASFNSVATAQLFAEAGWKRLKRCLTSPRKGIVLGASNVLMKPEGEREDRENSVNMCVLTWEEIFYSKVTFRKTSRLEQEVDAQREQLMFLQDCITEKRFVNSKRFYTLEEILSYYQDGKLVYDKAEDFRGTNTQSENTLQNIHFRNFLYRKLEPHSTEDVYVLDYGKGLEGGKGYLLTVDREDKYVTNSVRIWGT